MAFIEFSLDKDGIVRVKNQFNRRRESVELTESKFFAYQNICSYIPETFFENDKIHIERRTDNYLSIVSFGVYDFCRFRNGEKAKWFSLSLPIDFKKEHFDDPIFNGVKNKKIIHWKIPLQSFDNEFLDEYAEAIQKTVEWCEYQSEHENEL